MLFRDRIEAGKKLAQKLKAYANRQDVIVLGLLRGGVPVAFEVAQALNLPLDVFLVRKLGVPGQEEFAMGAIASCGVRLLNQKIIEGLHISSEAIARIAAREQRELERREYLYRDERSPLNLRGRTVIRRQKTLRYKGRRRKGLVRMQVTGLEEACTSPKPSSVVNDGACILKEKGGSKLFPSRLCPLPSALKGEALVKWHIPLQVQNVSVITFRRGCPTNLMLYSISIEHGRSSH